jgi:hypothetical protein
MAGVVAALLLGAPAAAFASPPVTAEAAIERQRQELLAAARIGCRRTGEETDEAIVVCGRGGVRPEWIPPEALDGDRPGFLPGEPPSGAYALEITSERCSAVGNRNCGAGFDVFKVGSVLFKIGKHILNKDD